MILRIILILTRREQKINIADNWLLARHSLAIVGVATWMGTGSDLDVLAKKIGSDKVGRSPGIKFYVS